MEALLKIEKSGGNSTVISHYKSLCVSLNRQVSFTRNKESVTGTAVDISPEGELIVRCEDGTLFPVNSGEVTVQGIYE